MENRFLLHRFFRISSPQDRSQIHFLMKAEGTIQYLRHGQIDKTKWDACIESSSNGLVYGYSFYLDQMAGNWEALVMDDYKIGMPLTARKKYGIQYLAQPFLAAQLTVLLLTVGVTFLAVRRYRPSSASAAAATA